MTRDQADAFAQRLGEEARTAILAIRKLVATRGVDDIQALVEEAEAIQAQGGMLVDSGTRQRTLGGVFFKLVKERIPDAERQQLFANRSTVKPFNWNARLALHQQIKDEPGVVKDVLVKLVGRPGKYERRNGVIMTTMQHQPNPGSLPANLPPLPDEPTTYTVYISTRQWDRVREAMRDPNTEFVVEGYCAFDEDLPGIAVFASSIRARPKKKSHGATAETKKTQPVPAQPISETQMSRSAVPADGTPKVAPDVAKKLHDLYNVRDQYSEKIAELEKRPADKRFGLEMTRRLLASVEKQIDALCARQIP